MTEMNRVIAGAVALTAALLLTILPAPRAVAPCHRRARSPGVFAIAHKAGVLASENGGKSWHAFGRQ
jgi:hypothetical protein